MKLLSFQKRVSRFALDLIFPRQCAACSVALGPDNDDYLCARCFDDMEWVAEPVCPACGRFLAGSMPTPRICSACVDEPPRFDRAQAIFFLEAAGHELVLKYKYAAQTHLSRPAARWLASRGAEFYSWRDYDFCLAVPLHHRKSRERGFNQSLLLARRFSRRVSLPLLKRGLVRIRFTPTQTRLTLAQRQENVQGAFETRNSERFQGRRLLLIDDVYTSGSTVNECARVLKSAGAARVDVLTLARVRR